jgi:hypothetical protein
LACTAKEEAAKTRKRRARTSHLFGYCVRLRLAEPEIFARA